jgi:hypothetical protein
LILFNEKETRIKTTMIDQDQNHDDVHENRPRSTTTKHIDFSDESKLPGVIEKLLRYL